MERCFVVIKIASSSVIIQFFHLSVGEQCPILFGKL